MTKPPIMTTDGCFTNANPPATADAAIDRIALMVELTVTSQQWTFDQPSFNSMSVRDTWNEHWGKAVRSHFSKDSWAREWKNVAVIATVHGCRAVDYARERNHQNGVTQEDLVDAGRFAARCCKQCYMGHFAQKEACWCNTEC